jgi:hypothetical protein
VITSGKAFVARPENTPETFAGTKVVEFSPTRDLQETIEVVNKTWSEPARNQPDFDCGKRSRNPPAPTPGQYK